jgi:hypothetical protein
MLERLEKIQWGLSGLVVIAFIALFAYKGFPPPQPTVLPPLAVVDAKEMEKDLSVEALERYRKDMQKASVGAKTLSKTQEAVPLESRPVPREVYDTARDERLAIAQLKLVAGRINAQDNTAMITDFKPGSYLQDLGFEKGDKVRLIDGRPIPVGDQAALRDLYQEKLEAFEGGQPLIITVERGGQPRQLIFRYSDVERLGR